MILALNAFRNDVFGNHCSVSLLFSFDSVIYRRNLKKLLEMPLAAIMEMKPGLDSLA